MTNDLQRGSIFLKCITRIHKVCERTYELRRNLSLIIKNSPKTKEVVDLCPSNDGLDLCIELKLVERIRAND